MYQMTDCIKSTEVWTQLKTKKVKMKDILRGFLRNDTTLFENGYHERHLV